MSDMSYDSELSPMCLTVLYLYTGQILAPVVKIYMENIYHIFFSINEIQIPQSLSGKPELMLYALYW